MTITQETQVADIANNLISLTAQLYGIAQQISATNAKITPLDVATKLAAFPTAAITATGGIGAADGTPNVAHPINTGVSPGTLINRAISFNDLAAILTYLTNIAAGINGSAVAAQSTAPTLIAKCL